ncbi:unannotated protein [freshwater metagenome]|jgi:hypothetical protein|uniref:Unannotated protein n=1 Tax=freshwater metagenome TaxID=449393 RepID=A0A6J7Q1T6_9ZZZZ
MQVCQSTAAHRGLLGPRGTGADVDQIVDAGPQVGWWAGSASSMSLWKANLPLNQRGELLFGLAAVGVVLQSEPDPA